MKQSLDVKMLFFAAIIFAQLSGISWGYTLMSGEAEVSYVQYDAKDNEKRILSGHSLVQKYSIDYSASSKRSAFDQRYYDLKLGYHWLDFNTKVTDHENNSDLNLRQSFGKFKYSGEVLYNSPTLPVMFKLFSNDYNYSYFDSGIVDRGSFELTSANRSSLYGDQLINDGLTYNINGMIKSVVTGGQFVFDPASQRSSSLNGLPKVMFDYREVTYKGTELFYHVDNRTRDLAIASLSKDNNWLQFRSTKYENFLSPLDRFERNTVIIGHIDNAGHRKWSNLTNWIEASADGRFTLFKTPMTDRNTEEYDANFFAKASRRSWEGRTFLNFNRSIDERTIVEKARIPLYLKGIYGSDITWHSSVSLVRGKQLDFFKDVSDTSYSNSVTLGGTAFQKSSFTLSPSLTAQTNKSAFGNTANSYELALESNSTGRFSNKTGIGGRIFWRAMDDGAGVATSNTWSAGAEFKGRHSSDNRLVFSLNDVFEFGDGQGYIDPLRLQGGTTIARHYRNNIAASASYTPDAFLSMSINGVYDFIKTENQNLNTDVEASARLSYSRQKFTFNGDTNYRNRDNGNGSNTEDWTNRAIANYRPDRNHDSALTFTHTNRTSISGTTSDLNLRQRYSYNFFTNDGVSRNFAVITQEFVYSQINRGIGSRSSQYLALSGRYSPTSKLALYGSVRAQRDESANLVMFYSTGLNADFKLMSTSLDYSYAKRDSDNRIEKKLAASVKRVF